MIAAVDLPARLRPVEYFAGTWSCRVTLHGHTVLQRSHRTFVLGRRWLRSDDASPPFRPGRPPVLGMTHIGYNAVSHRFAFVTVNSYGGYWIAESDGWHGDRWTWTDVTSEDGEWGRTVVVRRDAAHYEQTISVRRGRGPWKPAENAACTKTYRP